MTIKQAHRTLRAENPNFPVGLHRFYALVRSGVIPGVNLGRETLVDVDTVADHIMSGATIATPPEKGDCRPVS